MTFEQMQEYLENAGYNIDGMHSDEIDTLAMAEGFTFNDERNRYYYN